MDSMQYQAGPSSLPASTRRWPPRLYLAVDCGGTKSAATICDEYGQVLGKGRGGPSNFTDEGLQYFLASVELAVKEALENVRRHFARASESINWRWKPCPSSSLDTEAGIPTSGTISTALNAIRPRSVDEQAEQARFEAAWFGIAGVDSAADVTTLSPHLARLLNLPFPSSRLIVANDTSLLASPITDSSRPGIQSGIVAIAGTGSIVMSFKRSKFGMLKVLGRVGGLGWLLGDEGSGYLVGRTAIRRVLDLADRERLARELEEDGDSEDEAERCETEFEGKKAVKAHCDCQGVACADHADEGRYDTADEAEGRTGEHGSNVYGRLLRDRILQEWGLASTDDLLRAVYFEDCPNRFSSKAKLLQQVEEPFESNLLVTSPSDRDEADIMASPLPLKQEQPSLNLLPPGGSTLQEAARLKVPSPIPSLSSSPSPSDCSSAVTMMGQKASLAQSHGGSTSTITTDNSSVNSAVSPSDTTAARSTGDRKHRLASLTPLVFHLAFTHGDCLCMDILQSQAHQLALQIRELLLPSTRAKAHLSSHSSVLCLGGALVGQASYRTLLLSELSKLGIIFSAVEYVADPATRGAVALSNVIEQRAEQERTQ